jgi:prophage DNA circulation protein
VTSSSSTPQDKYLEALRQGQDTYVKAIQVWSDNVEKMLSRASSTAGQTPAPEEVIDDVFGFAEQLLAAQRDFAKRLLRATAPAVDAARSAVQPTTDRPGDRTGDRSTDRPDDRTGDRSTDRPQKRKRTS